MRSPCSQSIAEMARVGDGVRWCSSCEHEVHDLGELDEAQARALLRAHHGGSLCVRYASDPNGRLRFAPGTLSADRLTRRPRLGRFALAVTVSLVLMSGCASTRDPTPVPIAPTEPLANGDPWVVTLNFAVDPDADIMIGMVVVTDDGFVDPLVFELEDAIIPESITARTR